MSEITCLAGRLITTLLLSAVLSVQSSGAPETVTEQAIFRVLLAPANRSSRGVVVDLTPLHATRPTDLQWQWIGDSAVALKSPVEAGLTVAVTAFSYKSFPPGTTLVPHAQLPLRGTATTWVAFTERFGSREIVWFSRPVLSTDREHTLVYQVQVSGPEGGRSDLILMQRTSGPDEWTVVKALPLSVS
jgi:hypothetical protein